MILAARAVVNKRDGELEDGMSGGAKQPGRGRSTDVALEALARALPERINADPSQVENGLARLVLTVIELLREILEHQAIRRMDGGKLSEVQVERLAHTALHSK